MVQIDGLGLVLEGPYGAGAPSVSVAHRWVVALMEQELPTSRYGPPAVCRREAVSRGSAPAEATLTW